MFITSLDQPVMGEPTWSCRIPYGVPESLNPSQGFLFPEGNLTFGEMFSGDFPWVVSSNFLAFDAHELHLMLS